MKRPKTEPPSAPKKRGRKGGKRRSHVSIGEALDVAADFLGTKVFGSKSAYVEHLIAKDIERQGYTALQIVELAKEWEEKQRSQEAEGTKRD